MDHQTFIGGETLESAPGSSARPAVDEGEFQREIEAIIPALRGYAHSLCGSPDYGDDIVQDTLLRAWKARSSFQNGTHFKAWMFTILRNAYRTSLRRRKFHGDYVPGSKDHLSTPENQIDRLIVEDLKWALRRLPDEQRETLLLVVGGCSYIETAEICGCMIGTVKSRVGRARTTLQRLLEGASSGDGGDQPAPTHRRSAP